MQPARFKRHFSYESNEPEQRLKTDDLRIIFLKKKINEKGIHQNSISAAPSAHRLIACLGASTLL